MFGDSKLVLAVVDSGEIIGGRSKARIERQCLLVRLPRFFKSKEMVVRHADVVPDNGGFQIALLISGNRCSILSAGHQNIGLLFGRHLFKGQGLAGGSRRVLGRAVCGLRCRWLPGAQSQPWWTQV